ncbi:MAG: imidazole glycerol phosphate synthase subunit HisH [Proteobacteria bacterium]|nr:imidazole glycerol phosphate synthase subunit HisH [Pseudomonadota bacterium]MDA0862859.1 imidazole glycerol phosphate synthase subunit HisH [Pseudomonadota bacterium]MDA1031552.1 imidazole glycerol phosphate synthase subunit HisH [Pseudomonadota bacterium]
MALVVVVDYGMGNLRSVEKALAHVGMADIVKVSGHPEDIEKADKIVFPGQGAMPDCMKELASRRLIEPIRAASTEKPFLGICIGLQLLFERSEEGCVDGLGLLPGEVQKFSSNKLDGRGAKFKVPHMGWNTVDIRQAHPIFAGIDSDEYFYFVHSYFVEPVNSQIIVGKTDYINNFTSAVAHKNIVAVQFHPEKSQQAGLKILANFLGWDGCWSS